MRSRGEFRFGPGERPEFSGGPGLTGRLPVGRSPAVRLRTVQLPAALGMLAVVALLTFLSAAPAVAAVPVATAECPAPVSANPAVRAEPRQEPAEPSPAPAETTSPAAAPEASPSAAPSSPPAAASASAATPEERLVRVRRIFVESFGDDPISKQAEAMVVDALVKSKRFVVTENRDRADAILKGTAVEKRSQELHAISESGAASTAVVTQNSDYSANSSGSIDGRVSGGTGTIHGSSRGSASGSSSGVGVARSGAVEDSQVTTETIDDARISVRLVDPDGDVIWSTTQESRGAKYKGSSADAAEKVTKQLLREIGRIEKGGS